MTPNETEELRLRLLEAQQNAPAVAPSPSGVAPVEPIVEETAQSQGVTERLSGIFSSPLTTPGLLRSVTPPDIFTPDALANLNYGLASLVGIPVDLVSLPLKATGVMPADSVPIGSAQSIRDGLRALGVKLPEEGAPPQDTTERIARIAGETVLPAGALHRAGASLAMRSVDNLSMFQRSLVQAFNKPRTTAALEAAAVTGAGIGGQAAFEAYPDSQVAEVLGELSGGISPVVAAQLVRAGTKLPSVRAVKEVTMGGSEQERAVKQLRRSLATPEDALDNVIRETLLDLDPMTRSNDIGAISILKAALSRDNKMAARIQAIHADAADKAYNMMTEVGDPGAAIQFLDSIRNRAVAEATRKINSLGTNATPAQSAVALRESIESAYSRARQAETDVWNKVPLELSGVVDTNRIRNPYEEILRERSIAADPADIPTFIRRLLGDVDAETGMFTEGPVLKNRSVKELKDLRSRIGKEISKERAEAAPNENKLRVLRKIRESIYDSVAEVSPEWNKAVQYSREMNRAFTQGPIGSVLGFERSGGVRVTPEGTFDALFSSPENVRKSMNQLRESAPDTIPVIEQSLRQMFLDTSTLPSGAFDVGRANQFLRNPSREAVLNEFPELRQQMIDSIDSQRIVDQMYGANRAYSTTKYLKDKSVLSLYLDSTPDLAMKRILTARNSAEQSSRMRALVALARQDETGQASRGLKSAFGEFLMRHAELPNTPNEFSGRRLLKQVRDYEAAAKSLYTPEEWTRVQRIANELDRIDTFRGVKEADRVVTDVPNRIISFVGGTIAARAGAFLGKGSGATLRTASATTNEYNQFLGRLTVDGAEQVLVESMLDENLFRILMKEATPDNLRRFNLEFSPLIPAVALIGGTLAAESGSITAQELTTEELAEQLRQYYTQQQEPTQQQMRSTSQSVMGGR